MSEVPPNYYALSRSERDHLLAAAQLQDEAEEYDGGLPSGQHIQRQVETIRENERPGNHATYNALDALRDYGWMDKTDGYEVTTDGRRVLADAKTEIPE